MAGGGDFEEVRIIKDQTTTGTFTFDQVNKLTGSVNVEVSTDLKEPLPVTLSGAESELDPGVTMTVTAGVTGGSGDLQFTWYLDGVEAGSGASYTTSAALEPGFYRLAVAAHTADRSRGGSASFLFSVREL